MSEETIKPNYIKPILETIPDELKAIDRWVVWKSEHVKRWTKPPRRPNGGGASTTNPNTWSTFPKAWAAYGTGKFDGVGIVLNGDGLVGVDLDHVINEKGELDPEAAKIVAEFASYTELSPSGRGIRIFCKASLPGKGTKRGAYEIYGEGRYLTVTGNVYGDPMLIMDRQEVAARFYERLAGRSDPVAAGRMTDDEVVRLATEAKNGQKVKDLLAGIGGDDDSVNDISLCNLLAFYAQDAAQIDRIFRSSGLMRPKWDEARGESTYGLNTVKKALSIQKENYKGKVPIGLPEQKVIVGITAAELMEKVFPEPRWAIRDILPEGLTVLAGKPKKGKSIFALNILMDIADGADVLGRIQVEEGAAIYLALEDTQRRLQERIKKMLRDPDASEKLHLFTEWPRMEEGGLELLEAKISETPDVRIVVIDTLAKFRKPSKANSNLYTEDYETTSKIKEVADRLGVCIVLVHHLRKSVSDDIFDTVSGSLGLTGGADGILVLENKMGETTLHVTGRDMETTELAISLDSGNLRWNLLGPRIHFKNTENQQRIYDALMEASEPISPTEIGEVTGLKTDNVKKVLRKYMEEGIIQRTGHGRYTKKDKAE
jgi:hypothetical protein